MKLTERTIASFWLRVVKSDACWKWTGHKGERGYGIVSVNGRPGQKAHRLSYLIHFGELPDGLCVCHKCDNPECTNPDHLFLGTLKDNQQDCLRKGRKNAPVGERNRAAKLVASQILEIRRRFDAGESRRDLAAEFKVTKTQISRIGERKQWLHLDAAIAKAREPKVMTEEESR